MNRSVRVCGRGAGESLSHWRHSSGTNCVQSAVTRRGQMAPHGLGHPALPAARLRLRHLIGLVRHRGGQCTPFDAGRHPCEHMFVSGEATILHADLDAFFASVEQRDDPRLRGRPVIVGGGVVLAASYEARRAACAPPWAAARRAGCARRRSWCRPGCRPTRRPARPSSRCSGTPRRWSRGCRSTRPSSTWAGCGASPGTPAEIAARLRREVLDRVGLPITVGVARTKFLAKVASGVAKPDGLLVVPPEAELEFLHPAAGRAAVGRRPGHRPSSTSWASPRCGRWPSWRRPTLVSVLGRASGRHLHALAHNRDPRRVRSRRGAARSARSTRWAGGRSRGGDRRHPGRRWSSG